LSEPIAIGSWKVQRGKGRPTAYKLADGTRVPSVTTITSARKAGVEALLVWANRMGQEGKDHREVRQQAADAGSMVHAMVENSIHGRDKWEGIPPLDEKTNAQAEQGFSSFQDWSRVMHVQYLATETPMVSESFRYGGTPDALGTVDGKLALLDWKSSNAVYGDYIIQLAAYKVLCEEDHRWQRIDQVYLLRFGKDHGDFHCHSYPDSVLEMGWEAFQHLLALYDLDKQLKKVAT
jgi:hypothetical protein